jgi:hypothetical protein
VIPVLASLIVSHLVTAQVTEGCLVVSPDAARRWRGAQSQPSPARRPYSPGSGTPKAASTPGRPHARSSPATGRSGPRRPRRSPATPACSSPSPATRLSTGFTCAPPTRAGRPFAAVRLRQRVTRGPGSRAAGIGMAFQAHRVRTSPLVRGQRTPPGRLGPRRREVRERPARRTIRRIRRRSARRMTKAAVRPVGMSVSGNFRVRFGCLTGGVHGRTQACRVGR